MGIIGGRGYRSSTQTADFRTVRSLSGQVDRNQRGECRDHHEPQNHDGDHRHVRGIVDPREIAASHHHKHEEVHDLPGPETAVLGCYKRPARPYKNAIQTDLL